MLERETEKVIVCPVSDDQLFSFAQTSDWKNTINPEMLTRVANLIKDYETALNRVRHIKHISTDMKRKGDIYRILFARGQEKDYTVDELHSAFDSMLPQQIRKARLILDEVKWHLVPSEERTNILYTICKTGNLYDYLDVFCDFRNGGYTFYRQNNNLFIFFYCIIESDFGAAFARGRCIGFVVIHNAILAIIYHLIVAFDVGCFA